MYFLLINPFHTIKLSNVKTKKFYVAKGNGWFTTDLQCHILTPDGDPRTGTFPQTWPTVAIPPAV